MARYRLWFTALLLLGALAFSPNHAESRQAFDVTLKFEPEAGTSWHYWTIILLIGDEVMREKYQQVGGIVLALYDEDVTSSGGGLVGFTTQFNAYEALDLGWASDYEDPSGGLGGSPSYSAPSPESPDESSTPHLLTVLGIGDPTQIGGGGGGSGGGGGGGGGAAPGGEEEFEVTPIMESNIRYVMSDSGRILSVNGLDLIGDIIDPSRSITVRQLFETIHFVVLPDYQVHLNETWRSPLNWTIPFVGETMEIPLTFKLSDIRTTYRFRVAAIDFSGILQFDVDVSDEDLEWRKESSIRGDIIIEGRAYVDIHRGILVGICDTPSLGNTYFLDGDRRGDEWWLNNDLPAGWPLNPGFYARLKFERRDLYTPLGNVMDPRQEVVSRIQEMQWFTTTIVE
jgi:hypothetical protein